MVKTPLSKDQLYGRNASFRNDEDEQRALAPSIAKKKKLAIRFASKLIASKGDVYTDEKHAQLNRSLLDGEWPNIHKEYGVSVQNTIGEQVALTETELRHYPRIDKHARELISDLISPEISVSVVDTSANGATIRERMKIDVVRKTFSQTYIEPAIQAVKANPSATPEDIELAQQQAMESMPSDIYEGMKSVVTPSEAIARTITEDFVKKSCLKKVRSRAAEDYVATAQFYLHPTKRSGRVEVVRYAPEDCKWSARPGVRDVQDANWFVVTEKITFADLMRDHGESLKRSDVAKIYQYVIGANDPNISQNNTSGISVVDANEEFADQYDKAIIETESGQAIAVSISDSRHPDYSSFSNYSLSEDGGYASTKLIERSYVTWVWESKSYRIKRRRSDGQEYYVNRSEYYKPTASNGDLEVEKKYRPETWQATIFGAAGSTTSKDDDDIVSVDVGPVPFQSKSETDIYSAKLPVFGGITSGGVSPIDRGMNAQLDYNYLRRAISDKSKTSHGNVSLISEDLKPEGYQMGPWLSDVLRTGIGLKKHKDISPGSVDTGVINISLSRVEEMNMLSAQLGMTEADIRQAMYYSPVRSGEASQYANKDTLAVNAANADKALERFYDQFTSSIEGCVARLHALGRREVIENTNIRESLFGPYLAAYVLESEKYENPSHNIMLVDTRSEKQKLEMVRNIAISSAGNAGDIESVVEITMAGSIGEIKEIISRLKREQRESAQASAREENERIDKLIQERMETRAKEMDLKMQMARERNDSNERAAQERAKTMLYATDVDRDGKNDLNTRTEIQEEAKKERQILAQKHEKEMSQESTRRSERDKKRER